MFGKLICVAALASAVLAQGINITVPAAGSTVAAGSAITVEVERPAPSTATELVTVAIGVSACPDGCVNDGLGAVLYTGIFDPKSTNSEGNAFQNITVTVPNWFNGPLELNFAFFCLLGATTHTPELQFANATKLTVVGGSG